MCSAGQLPLWDSLVPNYGHLEGYHPAYTRATWWRKKIKTLEDLTPEVLTNNLEQSPPCKVLMQWNVSHYSSTYHEPQSWQWEILTRLFFVAFAFIRQDWLGLKEGGGWMTCSKGPWVGLEPTAAVARTWSLYTELLGAPVGDISSPLSS